ncbi:HD domain-containing protein [Paenimyroides aestuarii]|uniref:Metal-dependent HD superfamily phosphohydrolase n=1 Tax=Paenimyroides aestuarii TaxID=2968490 RepID=A0ABY5NRT8_9FLAO|nr:hypothetical protein [Paenimyroides aestuarii]UUV21286.1 hypothetical protein NPX36_13300 [Paenimyroides aestuarii]
MEERLYQKFKLLFSIYSDDKILLEEYWSEILKQYSSTKRYYHNLHHLDFMINELEGVKSEFQDWNAMCFSIFYHDIIYKSTAKNNEEKSAEIAKNRLQKISVPIDKIDTIYNQILATKKHLFSNDKDTNYLLDADLAILGKSWTDYEVYIKNIRKEYAAYPDFIYKPGRKNVLKHFLAFKTIYKTDFFYNKYELQARENMQRELKQL